MLSREKERLIFDMFGDEIEALNISNFELLEKCLIIYKLRLGINYKQSKKFSFNAADPTVEIPEETENGIVFGCKPMDDKYYDKTISDFLNYQYKKEDKYKVYLNKEKKLTQVWSSDAVQAPSEETICLLLTRLLPWYFKKEDVETVKDCIVALGSNEFDTFQNIFEVELDKHGYIDKINEAMMSKLGITIMEERKTEIADQACTLKREIEVQLNALNQLYDKLEGLQNEEVILKFKEEKYENPIKEIWDFITNSEEDITIVDVSKKELQLAIITDLNEVDEDQYEECIVNAKKSSYFDVHDDTGALFEEEDLKELYKRIFIDKELKLKVKCLICIDFYNKSLKAGDEQTITTKSAISHPHLRGNLGCFGTAAPMIATYIKQYRFTEALSQLLYAASQSTLSDLAANGRLIEQLSDSSLKPIQLPNGEFVNTTGAIEYIKNHKGE